MSFINYNNKWINKFFATGSSLSTPVTQTIMSEITIPANTYKSGDILALNSMFGKVGISQSFTIRYYWNTGTTANLSGALAVSIRGISAGSQFATHDRRLLIRTAAGTGSGILLGTEVANAGTGHANDYTPTTSSNLAIDWTVDGCIFITGQLALSSTDTLNCLYLKIWEW